MHPTPTLLRPAYTTASRSDQFDLIIQNNEIVIEIRLATESSGSEERAHTHTLPCNSHGLEASARVEGGGGV